MVRTIMTSLVKGENKKYESYRIIRGSDGCQYSLESSRQDDSNEYPQHRDAVKTLNTLQTNAQTLEKIRQERDKYAHLNVPKMINYAARAGITLDDMDSLNVIHISGTKGKGSTCAFCESILRHHGYRTGFFSSPHLVEVRERFVVDGSPLDRDKFSSYFWEVYNRLDKTKEADEGRMPNYFGFLTVMALHVFLQEKVDVAIMEVGIGGQFDSTNILRKPVVCGVTSLGLDHTSILGNTIDKIAWHKAGIFKPGVPAFTSPQLPEALTVLSNRAQEIGVTLTECPQLSVYEDVPSLGIKGRMQAVNASLALQLCQTWIKHHQKKNGEIVNGTDQDCNRTGLQPEIAMPFTLTQSYIQGLSKCQWLGRNQRIKESGLTFYLDGAHTLESVEQCVDWFKEESEIEKKTLRQDVYKILIFNMTGDRDVKILMNPLQTCDFDAVLFCPNIAYEESKSEDQTNKNITMESQLKRCSAYKDAWEKLEQKIKYKLVDSKSEINGHKENGVDVCTSSHASSSNHVHKSETQRFLPQTNNPHKKTFTSAFSCISNCVDWIGKHRNNEKGKVLTSNGSEVNEQTGLTNSKQTGSTNVEFAEGRVDKLECDQSIEQVIKDRHIQVLVTGSLHLVGGALKVIWDREIEDQ